MAAATASVETQRARCGRIGGVLMPRSAVPPPGSLAAALAGMRAALGPGAQLLNERECIADADGCFLEGARVADFRQALAHLPQLTGSFAVAWRDALGVVRLASDPIGQRRLYYAQVPRGAQVPSGALVFASTLHGVLGSGWVPRCLARSAVPVFLTFAYLPSEQTLVESVRVLPPGQMLQLEPDGALRITPYWQLPSTPTEFSSAATLCAQLRCELQSAVARALPQDDSAPVGCTLSGGIDSSLVVALMARQSTEPVRTFSIGFDFASFDERPYARMVAERYGTRHEEFVVNADLSELLPRLVWHYDDPFSDPSMIPTFRVSEIAARHVTVALSGDGGDESFGGYTRYVNALANNRADALPGAARDLMGWAARALPDTARGKNRLRWLSLSGDERYADFFASTPPHLVDRHLSGAMRNALATRGKDPETARRAATLPILEACPYTDPIARMQYFDAKLYLPGDILVKVDRASMASSLESREPLLDHHLMEFGLSLPPRLKIDGRQTKVLMARLARKLVPVEAVDRPKHGFSVPLDKWFRGELKGVVNDVLRDPRTAARGWLDPDGVSRTLAEHESGAAKHGTTLWGLMMLELWARRFLDGALDPPPAPPPRAAFLAGLRAG